MFKFLMGLRESNARKLSGIIMEDNLLGGIGEGGAHGNYLKLFWKSGIYQMN